MNPSRWPEHPYPCNEESLLSWLSRIANCYELSVGDLLKNDLGFHGDPNVLNVSVPDDLLTLLSNQTGVDKQKIRTLTLASWEPLLFNDITNQESEFEAYVHHYSLLLRLSNRKKYLPDRYWRPWASKLVTVSKACPECIKSNPVDVMSLAWCLPLMLSCPIHQRMLRECYCHHGCHIYWTKKERESFIPFSSAINTMDQRTWSALTTGQVLLPRRTINGGVWLRLLRTLLDELHIPIPRTHPFYADMVNIWDFALGLDMRCGQTRWKPYEFLPTAIQQLTLMAAATAIEQIENRTITPPGQQIHLFLPEPVSNEDLPSYPYSGSKTLSLEAKSQQLQISDTMEKIIELAKSNPADAIQLRNFILFGKTDFESIKKIDDLLIKSGVPSDFLVT
ncbi:TPA: TniQ family protein [Legionella pneumophila]|nr:TniQ family protein [Legionella pneumophila]HDV5695165.1 TniQ family protein [Legionella pneumophila]HDV5796872.1 TniQ family protein [Legionella pneumophila]